MIQFNNPTRTTVTTAKLIHNNAFDALVISNANGHRMHTIDGAETFLSALAVGDAQDLDSWSGDLLPDGTDAEQVGEVIAINDGETLTVLDPTLLEMRREFYRV
jgi:hypothetical protein